jgi:hypothetical protein
MSRGDLIIPIQGAGDLFKPLADRPVQGGGSRLVPGVPTPHGVWPCIWKSHQISEAVIREGGKPERVYECILLTSKNPPQTIRAQIEAEGFKTFQPVAIEW